MPGGRLIIVSGLPATGKTTLARELEHDLGAVRLCPDEWLEALDIDLYDGAARERIEQLQWQLAQRLLELGATVIVEWGTWSRTERDALRERARELGAATELRFLDAPPEVLPSRIQRGHHSLTPDQLEAYAAAIERPGPDELALFDPPAG